MNRQANYQYEWAWKALEDLDRIKKGEKPEYAKDLMLGLFTDVFLPGLIDTVVSDVKATDSYAQMAAKGLATGMAAPWVGVRELNHAILTGADPSIGLASEEFKIFTSLVRDVAKGEVGFGKENLGKTVKHANNMIGILTGMTNGEVGNMFQFLIDLQTGKAKPKTAADWWRGMTKGEVKQAVPRPDIVERILRIIK